MSTPRTDLPLGLDLGRPITLTNLVLATIRHSSLCAIFVSGHRDPCNCGAKAE